MEQNRSSHIPSEEPHEPKKADTEQPAEADEEHTPLPQPNVERNVEPDATASEPEPEDESAAQAPGETVAFTPDDLENVAEAAAEAAAASAALDSLSRLTVENVVETERPEAELDLDEIDDGALSTDAEPAPEPEPDGQPAASEPEERPADLPLTQVLPNFSSTQAVDDTIDASAPQAAREWKGPENPGAIKARRRGRIATVVCVVAIILVVVGCFAYFGDWSSGGAESAITGGSTTMCSVTVSVDISGLDTETGSKIPIKVEGEDADGNAVSQVQYIDESGAGLSLMNGTYTLTVAASPIAGDGTIYTVPETSLEVTVENDGQDLSSSGTFVFTVPAADSVTDSQINNAYEYASEGGCTSDALAQILKDAATERRDAAVEASEARTTELLEEADERHKATPTYSFDIPEEWYGKVDTWQNENTVGIYLVDDPNITLLTLTLREEGYDEGDAEYGALGAVSLGDGTSVVVEGPVWPWLLSQTLNGRTDEPSTTYSSSTAEEITELMTGSPYTSAQIRALVDDDGDATELTEMVEGYLAEVLLPSIEAA